MIMERNLVKQKYSKLMKTAFLALLENILIQKKKNIVHSTVTDFRKHILLSKGYRGFKRLWSHTHREKVMNKIAKDFYHKIQRRRELKRRQ
jgi:hypothetical protein